MNYAMNGPLSDEARSIPEEFASFTKLLDLLLSVPREDARAREPLRAKRLKGARPTTPNSPEPDSAPDPEACPETEVSNP
jgi:hypothetical protein